MSILNILFRFVAIESCSLVIWPETNRFSTEVDITASQPNVFIA